MRAGRKLEEMYGKPSDTEPKLQMLLKASGGNQDLAASMMSGVIDVKSDGQGGFVMINEASGQATPMGGQQAAQRAQGRAGQGSRHRDAESELARHRDHQVQVGRACPAPVFRARQRRVGPSAVQRPGPAAGQGGAPQQTPAAPGIKDGVTATDRSAGQLEASSRFGSGRPPAASPG